MKSQTTTWDVKNLLSNGVNYLSTGAGFLPSRGNPSKLPYISIAWSPQTGNSMIPIQAWHVFLRGDRWGLLTAPSAVPGYTVIVYNWRGEKISSCDHLEQKLAILSSISQYLGLKELRNDYVFSSSKFLKCQVISGEFLKFLNHLLLYFTIFSVTLSYKGGPRANRYKGEISPLGEITPVTPIYS